MIFYTFRAKLRVSPSYVPAAKNPIKAAASSDGIYNPTLSFINQHVHSGFLRLFVIWFSITSPSA
ncbi:MAG TPA: hypothetical protein DC053_16460 [Lachnoclostridium sp.]|nr:hypothetical protein [Lachnoclostridium sp.]